MVSREENLLNILRDLRAQGVRYRLIDGVFKYDKTTVKDDLLRESLEVCRPGLTYILRLKEGLCIHCGLKKAERPLREKQSCEQCYWATVNPIMDRLRLSEPQQKRAARQQASIQASNAEEEEECLLLV